MTNKCTVNFLQILLSFVSTTNNDIMQNVYMR